LSAALAASAEYYTFRWLWDRLREAGGAVCFSAFVWLWNSSQHRTTPVLHDRLARWLEHRFCARDRQLLLSVFRDAGKSTLVGLFCGWLLLRNPDTRILVLAAEQELANKMTRNTRRLVERHPLTAHLVPSEPEQWAADSATVRRSRDQRDPSLLARGIGGNITGTRADVIVCDDVEVPNTCDTPAKRTELRERLGELSFVLVPGGTQVYIGTPHSYYSIYAEQPRHELAEQAPFLQGFARFEQPIVDGQGVSVWPARFDGASILRRRARGGPAKFRSQMLLAPTRSTEARLDPELLVAYQDELRAEEGNGELVLRIGGRRMLQASAWWDPSLARAERGDASVIAVMFLDAEGDYWLHDIEYITVPRLDPGGDRLTPQCRRVAEFVRRNAVPALQIETNGVGGLVPGALRQTLAAAGLRTAVIERTSARNKAARILEALDPVMAGGRLRAHARVLRSPLVEEMREWRPEGSARDDGLLSLIHI
jgi:hypothetical protein